MVILNGRVHKLYAMDEENNNLQDNENQESQQNPNPQPQQQQNLQDDLNQDPLTQDLEQMQNLMWDLRSTSEPSWLSLDTTLKNSIDFLTHGHHKLNNMIEYRVRMKEYYSNGLTKEKINDLNITKPGYILCSLI